MNRASRRKMLTAKFEQLFHELDDDAVCIHCGFDAAEEHHIRTSIPPEARPEKPDYAKYCPKRNNHST